MFLKACAMENEFFFFFEIKDACKMSRVKIIVLLIVVKKGKNIVIFYNFELGAEYGAECSAESAAKWCFIL